MTWRDLDIYLMSSDMTVSAFFALGGRLAELLSQVKMSHSNECLSVAEFSELLTRRKGFSVAVPSSGPTSGCSGRCWDVGSLFVTHDRHR